MSAPFNLPWRAIWVTSLVGTFAATLTFFGWLTLYRLWLDHVQLQQIVTLIQSGQIQVRPPTPAPAPQPPPPGPAK